MKDWEHLFIWGVVALVFYEAWKQLQTTSNAAALVLPYLPVSTANAVAIAMRDNQGVGSYYPNTTASFGPVVGQSGGYDSTPPSSEFQSLIGGY